METKNKKQKEVQICVWKRKERLNNGDGGIRAAQVLFTKGMLCKVVRARKKERECMQLFNCVNCALLFCADELNPNFTCFPHHRSCWKQCESEKQKRQKTKFSLSPSLIEIQSQQQKGDGERERREAKCYSIDGSIDRSRLDQVRWMDLAGHCSHLPPPPPSHFHASLSHLTPLDYNNKYANLIGTSLHLSF